MRRTTPLLAAAVLAASAFPPLAGGPLLDVARADSPDTALAYGSYPDAAPPGEGAVSSDLGPAPRSTPVAARTERAATGGLGGVELWALLSAGLVLAG
ncbi:hypothetical protein ACVU7I_15345, partial [Patulibacter sp. S7RM1-6]